MSDQWFYRLFGEEFGPVPREALTDLAAKGTLADSDEVRAADDSRWQTLEQALSAPATVLTAAPEVATLTEDSADDELVWYYEFMGDQMGPVSFNELLNFASIGQLTADDQVKFGVDGKWRRLGAIGRLVAVLPYQDPAATCPSKPARDRTPAPETPILEEIPASEPPLPAAAPAAPSAPPVPRYLPAAEEKTWYAWIRGTEYGPTDLIEINQWVTSGQIGAADFVRYGMMGQWAPSSTAVQALAQLRMPDPVAASPPAAAKPPMPATPVVATPPAATKAALPLKLPEPTDDPVPIATRPSSPPAETPKSSPKPKVSTPPPEIDAERRKPTPPPEERKPEPRPVMEASKATSSSYGGGLSSPPAWQAPKPAAAYKPPPRKSSSGGAGLNLGGLFEPLKDPKVMGGVGGALAVVALICGWMFMPASKGADIAKLKQLEQVLADFRKTREEKGDWQSFTASADKIAKPIVEDLKNTANRKAPAKQCLLWAARDSLPRMLSSAKDKPSAAEKEFENHLFEAARILKIGSPPPRPSATEDDAAEGDG